MPAGSFGDAAEGPVSMGAGFDMSPEGKAQGAAGSSCLNQRVRNPVLIWSHGEVPISRLRLDRPETRRRKEDSMRTGRVFSLALVFAVCVSTLAQAVLPDDFDVVIPRNGMPNIFARLNSGQNATIAYIGGSVTEMTGWRDNVTAWFNGHYPGKITEINAGWSGTGSAIGALRLGRDVLAHNPDLVFIEFAINDETGDTLQFIMQNYDGMVRQIWQQNPMTDICFIETIAWYIEGPYLGGYLPTSVDAHYQVADHYMIPSVNVGWALYQHVLAGTPWENLAPDRAHPNAAGHQIYSDAIIQLLDPERTAGDPASAHPLIAPKTSYPIDGADIVELGEISLPSGWTRGTGMGVNSFAQSTQQNAEITLSFNGPIAVLKFIQNTDGGVVGYSIDGAPFTSIDLSFGWTWVWAKPIGKMLSTGSHTVRLRVLSSSGVVRLVNLESSIPYNPQPPTPTPPPGANLSQGRPGYASTSYNGDFGPENAVDGLIDGINKWCSTGVDPSWWYVDLGAAYAISQVKVYAAGAGGEWSAMNLQAYTVRGSNSNATTPGNWTILATYNTGGADGADMVSHNVTGNYRYVGIYITDSGIDSYSRVPEIQVFGGSAAPTNTPVPTATNTPVPVPTDTPVPTNTPAPTSTPIPTNTPVPTNTIAPGGNLSEGRPAYASTSYNGDFGPENAVDGLIDGMNKWCSTGADPSWWYVDLGASYAISEVKVYAAGSGGEAAYMNLQVYTVRASNSNATTPDNWTILATYNSGGGDGADMVSHSVSGSYRYVGIYITDSGIDAYSRVPEIQVFGGGVAPTNTPGTPPTSTPTPAGPYAQEDFEAMPSWSSTYNATWGSAATWSIVSGGQSGNYLKASRSSQGSSSRVLVYSVPANTDITISCFMRCPSFGGSYWTEFGYRLGSHTAEDFDQNGGTWTLIRKFDSSGSGNGNGDTWVSYSAEINTGSNTQISIGFKLGSYGGGGPNVGWDTLRIEESQGFAGGPLFRVLQVGFLRPGTRQSFPG